MARTSTSSAEASRPDRRRRGLSSPPPPGCSLTATEKDPPRRPPAGRGPALASAAPWPRLALGPRPRHVRGAGRAQGSPVGGCRAWRRPLAAAVPPPEPLVPASRPRPRPQYASAALGLLAMPGTCGRLSSLFLGLAAAMLQLLLLLMGRPLPVDAAAAAAATRPQQQRAALPGGVPAAAAASGTDSPIPPPPPRRRAGTPISRFPCGDLSSLLPGAAPSASPQPRRVPLLPGRGVGVPLSCSPPGCRGPRRLSPVLRSGCQPAKPGGCGTLRGTGGIAERKNKLLRF